MKATNMADDEPDSEIRTEDGGDASIARPARLYGPKSKLYRDNVWTEIHLSTLAAQIISTSEFQRLDSIKQLGFSDLVYRGAKHTRFLHSVGTYHVAKRIASHVWENHERFGMPAPLRSREFWEEVVEIVGLAALLHDITHIPNGHALEDEHQDLYDKHDSLESPRLWYFLYDSRSNLARIFEDETAYFVHFSNAEVRDLIYLVLKYKATIKPPTDEVSEPTIVSFPDEIARSRKKLAESNSLVKDPETAKMSLDRLERIHAEFSLDDRFEPFMSDIVGNTICADLIDYLARDAQGTGLKFGYDERIERYLTIQKEEVSNQRRLVLKLSTQKGFKLDISSTMADLIGMRYSLAEKVYYHKTKVAADVMLGALLSLVEPPSDRNPYASSGAQESHVTFIRDEILAMGDADLLEYCARQIGDIRMKGDERRAIAAEKLLASIRERRIFKPCVILQHKPAQEIDVRVRRGDAEETRPLYLVLYDIFRRNPEKARNVEAEIDSLFGDGQRHAIVFCPSHKPQAKEAKTIVEARAGEVKPLHVLQNSSNSPLPSPLKIRLDATNAMYGELWKLFVFLRSEDFAKPVVRHGIAIAFLEALRRLGVELDSGAIRRAILPPLRPPAELVADWIGSNAHWTDNRIVATLEAMAINNEEWVALAVELGTEAADHRAFLDLCYVRKLREYYEAESETRIDEVPALDLLRTISVAEQGLVMGRTTGADKRRKRPLHPHWGALVKAGFVGGGS